MAVFDPVLELGLSQVFGHIAGEHFALRAQDSLSYLVEHGHEDRAIGVGHLHVDNVPVFGLGDGLVAFEAFCGPLLYLFLAGLAAGVPLGAFGHDPLDKQPHLGVDLFSVLDSLQFFKYLLGRAQRGSQIFALVLAGRPVKSALIDAAEIVTQLVVVEDVELGVGGGAEVDIAHELGHLYH